MAREGTLVARLDAAHPAVLSLTRFVGGLMFLPHGTMKLFGFPEGNHMNVQWTSVIGAAGIIEVVTGLMIMLGFRTRLAAFVASGQMAVAYWWRHAPKAWWPDNNGGEPAVLFCFLFFYLIFAGSGPYSLDNLLGGRRR
jgi:putative oxidoreductase